ncbi:MAG: SRPBCC family protein [Cellvibrionales bacterium]|nr:SRPBCC family protein [Cellvibrionales bacterium]
MHPSTQVSPEYFTQVPYRFSATTLVESTPEKIFDVFEDENSWPKWAPPIKQVDWTSEKPYGVGTTRRVTMVGMVGDEVFIEWDYPKVMAFCFTHSSSGLVESFAERYELVALSDGKVALTWTMAMTPKGLGKLSLFLSKPIMGLGLKWMLSRLKNYIESC